MESSQPGEHESDFCGLYALMLSHDTTRREKLNAKCPFSPFVMDFPLVVGVGKSLCYHFIPCLYVVFSVRIHFCMPC